MKILKKLLDILPLNGSKTESGVMFLVYALLSSVAPGLQVEAAIQYLLANPSKTGIAAVVIGLIHKELKRRAPEAPEL